MSGDATTGLLTTDQGTAESETTTEAVSEIPSAAELAVLLGMAPAPAPEAPTSKDQTPISEEETAAPAVAEPMAGKPAGEADAAAGETPEGAAPETKPEGEAKPEAEVPEKTEEPAQPDPLKKQIEELQAEIAALKAAKPEPKQEPVDRAQETAPAVVPARAEFFGLDALTLQEVRAAEKVKRWAEANPEGGEVAGADGQPENITPARVQALLSESNGILAAARQAGRERFTQAQRQADEYVRVHYPTLADKRSEDYAAYERVIALMPQLKEAPDVKVQVGRLLRGFRAEQEEIKQRQAAAQPKAPAKETAVPRAPAAGVVPRAAVVRTKPQTSQRDTQLAELHKRASEGDQAAAEQYFAMQSG